MSWLCTTELALQAKPDQLLDIASAFLTNDTDTDDAAQAMIDLGVGGWAGFSGNMETGFGNLVEALGKSMKSVAVAAGEAEAACKNAGETLDTLKTESDALLTTAEGQQTDLDALEVNVADWNTKRYWRRRAYNQARVDRTEDPATYDEAVRRLQQADTALSWLNTAVAFKRAELDASQVTFDRIRDDEELAESDLSTALSPVHDTLSTDELEFSADDLEGIDIVLDIFDLAYLAIAVDSKDDATARRALRDARNALADLVGVDTTARDEEVAREEARRELAELGPEGYEQALREAVEAGDTDAMRRLAYLLANGLEGMSAEEAEKYRAILEKIGEDLETFARGFRHFFLFFLGADAPVPDWVLDIVINAEGGIGQFGIGDIAVRDELARLFGLDPEDPLIGEKLLTKLYERIVDERGYEFVTALLASDDDNPIAAVVAFEYLLDNPNKLSDLVNGDPDKLQDVLEVLGENGIEKDDWDRFVEAYAGEYPLADKLNDPDLREEQVWQLFGADIANLQKQIKEIGGPGYEWNGIVTFVLKQGLNFVPGGGHINTALSAIETGISGYQADDTYERLDAELAADLDRQALVLGAMLQADPGFAVDVQTEMDVARQRLISDAHETGTEPDLSDTAIFQKMIQINGSAAHQIEVNANHIEVQYQTTVDGE